MSIWNSTEGKCSVFLVRSPHQRVRRCCLDQWHNYSIHLMIFSNICLKLFNSSLEHTEGSLHCYFVKKKKNWRKKQTAWVVWNLLQPSPHSLTHFVRSDHFCSTSVLMCDTSFASYRLTPFPCIFIWLNYLSYKSQPIRYFFLKDVLWFTKTPQYAQIVAFAS